MPNRRGRLGARGEAAVAEWYAAHGYAVVDRNWRCPDGELDLVLTGDDGAVIVFCEVKTRVGSEFGSPFEAVTRAKLARVRRLAGRWLAEAKPPGLVPTRVRVDVAAVRTADRSFVVDVVHDAR